jgi:hypothetical protein
MGKTLRAAGALLLAAACASPQAQTIYRCGNSYGSQPCADGKPLEAAPAPSNADRAQAAANSRRDAQMADALQKDRLRRETQAGNTNSFYVPPPAFEPERPSEHKSPEKAATRKLDVFTATAPGSMPAKKPAKDKKDAPAAAPDKHAGLKSVQVATPAKK